MVDTLCECLKTTDLENEELQVELGLVDKVVEKGKKCLVVKLLTRKYFNWEAFKMTMKKVWHPTKSLRFSDMGESLMMAKFEISMTNSGWCVMVLGALTVALFWLKTL